MVCQRCGRQIADGTKFCGFCGSPQQEGGKIRCSVCGAQCSSNNIYCDCCGSRLQVNTNAGADKPQHEYLQPEKDAAPAEEFEFLSSGEDYVIKKYTGHRKHLVIPESVRGRRIVGIEPTAFRRLMGCSLESVVIPESIRILPAGVFVTYGKLKSVKLHPGIEEIGENAFFGCTELEILDFGEGKAEKGVVYFPKKLKRIGVQAFSGSDRIREVTLSRSTVVESRFMYSKTFNPKVTAIFYYKD